MQRKKERKKEKKKERKKGKKKEFLHFNIFANENFDTS